MIPVCPVPPRTCSSGTRCSQAAMSSTGTPPPLPNTSFNPTATSSSTATSTSTSGAGTTTTTANTGTPASATLLFGFLVIFVALFAAFVLLAVLWQCQRRRREAAAPQIMLEFDESKGTYKGVPEMREVWIQEEPSGGRHWEWENIRVSVSFFYLFTRDSHIRYSSLPLYCAVYGAVQYTFFFRQQFANYYRSLALVSRRRRYVTLRHRASESKPEPAPAPASHLALQHFPSQARSAATITTAAASTRIRSAAVAASRRSAAAAAGAGR